MAGSGEIVSHCSEAVSRSGLSSSAWIIVAAACECETLKQTADTRLTGRFGVDRNRASRFDGLFATANALKKRLTEYGLHTRNRAPLLAALVWCYGAEKGG